MPSLKDVKEIPAWGKDLVIVAEVNRIFHVRVFGGDGGVLFDGAESRLTPTSKSQMIEPFVQEFARLSPPHSLTPGERSRFLGEVWTWVGREYAPDGPAGFVFAFRVLPTVIFVAALFAVLYHLGIMQWVVRLLAIGMEKLMGASGAESLNVAASLFLGQTEAPLTIRPYLPKLTRSELLTVMTSGMAHVSGGVMAAYFAFGVEPRHILTAVIMTAPGTILLSKMLIPETGKPETLGSARPDPERPDANLLDAASRGTREGLATGPEHRGHADLVPGHHRAHQQGLVIRRDLAPADFRLGSCRRSPGSWASPGRTARASAACSGRGRCSTS